MYSDGTTGAAHLCAHLIKLAEISRLLVRDFFSYLNEGTVYKIILLLHLLTPNSTSRINKPSSNPNGLQP